MLSTDGILGRSFALSVAALDGLSKRQALHTENLANIDTEGYRVKTLDFESVLQSELDQPNPGHRFGGPLQGSSGTSDAAAGGDLTSRFKQGRGMSGDFREQEVAAMMKDNIKFRVITQQVTNQLSAVRSVIAEMGRG